MTLYRGVIPLYFDPTQCSRDQVNRQTVESIQKQGLLEEGDLLLLTKGDHMGVGGGSNALKILVVGAVL